MDLPSSSTNDNTAGQYSLSIEQQTTALMTLPLQTQLR